LTLRANIATTYACEKESLALAEALDLFAQMEDCLTEAKKVSVEQ
jgi:hypothetical protein